MAHVLAAFVIWLAGGRVRTRLETLPRHRLLGAVLAAAAVGWAAWNMYAGDLGRFNALKPWLAVAARPRRSRCKPMGSVVARAFQPASERLTGPAVAIGVSAVALLLFGASRGLAANRR